MPCLIDEPTDPISSDQTILTEVYLETFSEFVDQLTNDELKVGYFRQDGAIHHTSSTSMTKTFFFFLWHSHLQKSLATKITRPDAT